MKPIFALLLCATGAFIMVVQPGTAQQTTAQPRPPLPDMQAIADALGVTCDYCHARGPGAAKGAPASGPSHYAIARQMIAMTRELNTTVQTATGKEAAASVKVDCVTCHRGVPVPKQLGDVLADTARTQGVDAAIEQYRDLRTRFYGMQAYDFGEQTLIKLAQKLANVRPDDAIALAQLNTEFYPASSASYAALAYAYTRKVDDRSAIAALEKAVELDPGNNVARGQLEQLKSYQRRR